jgi:hypothetical protein
MTKMRKKQRKLKLDNKFFNNSEIKLKPQKSKTNRVITNSIDSKSIKAYLMENKELVKTLRKNTYFPTRAGVLSANFDMSKAVTRRRNASKYDGISTLSTIK